tara:strand:+ start:142 stop:615 length:474 start_codon:yes stop_codon:yes gene_type:complete
MNISGYYELTIEKGNDYNFLNVEIIKFKLDDLKDFKCFLSRVMIHDEFSETLNVSYHAKKKDVFEYITEVIPNDFAIQLYYDRGQDPDEEKRFFEVSYKEGNWLHGFSNQAVYQFKKNLIDEDFTYTNRDGTEGSMTFKRILFPNPKKVPYYEINWR